MLQALGLKGGLRHYLYDFLLTVEVKHIFLLNSISNYYESCIFN